MENNNSGIEIIYKSHTFRLSKTPVIWSNCEFFQSYLYEISPSNTTIAIPEYIEYKDVKYYISSINGSIFKFMKNYFDQLNKQFITNIDPNNKLYVNL